MGTFMQKILVQNAFDIELVRRKMLKKGDIRQIEVDFLVDTGAYMMCINENIQSQLDLPLAGEHEVELADGTMKKLRMVTGLEIKIFNRRMVADALVLPGDTEPLLGSIPLEALDLLIDPLEGALKLPPDRPYLARTLLK